MSDGTCETCGGPVNIDTFTGTPKHAKSANQVGLERAVDALLDSKDHGGSVIADLRRARDATKDD